MEANINNQPDPEEINPRKISRRKLLELLLGSAFSAVVANTLLGCSPTDGEGDISRGVREGPASADNVKLWLLKGEYLRSDGDRTMLNIPQPGIDLDYQQSQIKEKIGSIADPKERIITAIGYLGVEKNNRYNYSETEVYTCNIYALDLLRLLLGEGVIGSRYNKATGSPTTLKDSQRRSMTEAQFIEFNNLNLALHANNLDWWMGKHGVRLGWEKVNTQQELYQRLSSGYVGLAATNHKIVEIETADLDEGESFYGHSLVIFAVPGGMLGISQSTHNIQLEEYPLGSDYYKVDPQKIKRHDLPELCFWVKKLP